MTDIKALREEVERYFTNGNQFDRMATAEQVRALLDELALLREDNATLNKLIGIQQSAHEEAREAAEAKLAAVRKVAGGTADWHDEERQAGDGFVRGQLLAILDAEPEESND